MEAIIAVAKNSTQMSADQHAFNHGFQCIGGLLNKNIWVHAVVVSVTSMYVAMRAHRGGRWRGVTCRGERCEQ